MQGGLSTSRRSSYSANGGCFRLQAGYITRGHKGSYGSIISEIKSRSLPFQCNFSFEGRRVNFEAHKLARFSLSLAQGRHVWLGQPHDQVCIPLSGL